MYSSLFPSTEEGEEHPEGYKKTIIFLEKFKGDLVVACHTPLLIKIKKQGEMPLPIPSHSENVEFMGPRAHKDVRVEGKGRSMQ